MRNLSRRQFLWIAGGFSGSFAAAMTLRPLTASHDGPELRAVTRKSWALGSDVEITALHADEQTAAAAIDAAFAELELVESLLSIYRPDSQLSRLNREKALRDPHPYLVEVLCAAEGMSRRSGGAFDVTVQPLWELYSQAAKAGRLPDPTAISQMRIKVDWRRVQVSDKYIRLDGDETLITLNGIAQGFATDRAAAAIRACGVEHTLINAGEIGALGCRSDGNAWTIGIQHPRHDDAFVALAALQERFLATSGDYATKFTDDCRAHHVFDPRTGQSPSELSSVTVAAPTALQADALSTAAFVLGAERGLTLISETPGCDALLVTKGGAALATQGFPYGGADV